MTTPTVIVDSLNNKEEGFPLQIYNASKQIGLEEDIKSAKSIFIKPNLTYPVYKKGVVTRFEFVRDLVSVINRFNPDLRIYIGEGEGGYNSFSMSEAFKNMRYLELEKEYKQVKIVNISKIPSKTIEIDTLKGPFKIALPGIFFNEIDFSISCPVPKVHCMTKITLSYKNQWGCLPDTMRLKNHYMFNYIISKISDILKFKYVFLDGKYGLDNNGPMVGDPVMIDWFVASNSMGAFDKIVSGMMGFKWRKVKHLKIAEKYGFIPEKEDIRIIGDIELLKRQFILKRNFWNYPALCAFHMKKLTHLVYLSRWAKLIHDVMYTVRKKPID
jgi:uncharacterized protein (DUF362 family)